MKWLKHGQGNIDNKGVVSKEDPKNLSIIKDEIATSSMIIDNDVDDEKKFGFLLSFLIGIFIALLLLGSTAYAAYYTYNRFVGNSTKEYVASVTAINEIIKSANDEMVMALKKDEKTLPVDAILEQIPKSLENLNKAVDKYNKVIAPSTYSSSNRKLDEAIKYNKLIYQQLELILKNPLDSNLQKNMDLLSQYTEESANNYAAIKIKNVTFSFPDEILTISSKVDPWVKQKQSEYSHVMSLIQAFTKYFDDMYKLFVDYDNAAVDLTSDIANARNGVGKWDDILSDIELSEKAIRNIKAAYNKISVPQELQAFHKRFSPVLDDWVVYCGKLRLAVQAEKKLIESKPTPDVLIVKKVEIEGLYQNAEKYHSSSSSKYKKFASDMKAEKDKYLNPEFVMTLKKK